MGATATCAKVIFNVNQKLVWHVRNAKITIAIDLKDKGMLDAALKYGNVIGNVASLVVNPLSGATGMLGEGAEIANTAIALGIKAAQKALPIALTGVNYVKKKKRYARCIKMVARREDCDYIINKPKPEPKKKMTKSQAEQVLEEASLLDTMNEIDPGNSKNAESVKALMNFFKKMDPKSDVFDGAMIHRAQARLLRKSKSWSEKNKKGDLKRRQEARRIKKQIMHKKKDG